MTSHQPNQLRQRLTRWLTRRPRLNRERLLYGLWLTTWLLIAALTFRATDRWLMPQDRLLKLAPDTAISYLHLNRPSANDLAGILDESVSLAQLPQEAARLVMPLEASLTRPTYEVWLLAWPSEAPAQSGWLNEAGWQADMLTDGVQLLWPDSLALEINGVFQQMIAAQRTLDRHPLAEPYLARARRLASRQWLILPENRPFTPDQPNNPAWLSDLSALVIASNTPDLSYAHIYPLQAPLIPDGPLEKYPLTESELPDFRPAGSQASLNGSAGLIDWPPLMLYRINRWRLATGLDPVELPPAREIHPGPVALSIMPATDRPGLGTHVLLQGANIDQVDARLSEYLDQVLPIRTVTVLPDKDQVTELVVQSGNNRFRPTDQPDTRFLWNRPADLQLYLTSRPGGVILSDLAWEDPINENVLDLSQCDRIAGNRLIIRDNYLEFINYLVGYETKSDDVLRLFIEKEDNLWITCSINPHNVDKLINN